MDLKGYISALERYKHIDSNITYQTSNILAEFSSEDHLSAYKIYTRIKNDPDRKTIAYKNINKHVKRLESLEFIVPVKLTTLDDNIHAAKYYQISEAGIFHLCFQGYNLGSWSLLPKILENYGNSSIFEILVYPYFKRETLIAIKKLEWIESFTIEVMNALRDYLENCCMEIRRFMNDKPYKSRDFPMYFYQGLNPNRSRAEELEDLNAVIIKLAGNLVLKTFLGFQQNRWIGFHRHPGKDIYTILAQDDKFMDNVDDLLKGFKRSLKIALRLRNRS